ncbi:DUF397 domain-containing protein [Streptomyces sp. NPDC047917]|uniref:DUF397 domain-containing protein n=1 Tax=Streptomyces sp. NPDC047917 TaxID=3365491 RepID=UPI00371C743D
MTDSAGTGSSWWGRWSGARVSTAPHRAVRPRRRCRRGHGGSACQTPRGADWFKSSYSNAQGGNRVEGARLDGHRMAVRDSKDPGQGACVFPAVARSAFVDGMKAGDTVA